MKIEWNAEEWKNAGWEDLEEAQRWFSAGWTNPRVAFEWYDAGWDEPEFALDWYNVGWKDPVRAREWYENVFGSEEAKEWEEAGFDPSSAYKWRDYEFYLPDDAAMWVEKGIDDPETLREWLSAGWEDVDVDTVVEWYKAFRYEPPDVIYRWYKLWGDLETSLEWYKHVEDPEVAHAWASAGWEDPKAVSYWIFNGWKDPVEALKWYQAGWKGYSGPAFYWRKAGWTNPSDAWKYFSMELDRDGRYRGRPPEEVLKEYKMRAVKIAISSFKRNKHGTSL